MLLAAWFQLHFSNKDASTDHHPAAAFSHMPAAQPDLPPKVASSLSTTLCCATHCAEPHTVLSHTLCRNTVDTVI